METTLHEGYHKDNNLSQNIEETLAQNYSQQASDLINFYHNRGDYSDSSLSSLVSWGYANSSLSGQYNASENYLNNFYGNSTANVTQASIAVNSFTAANIKTDEVETYQKDVHKHLTRYLAENAGYTPEEARQVAAGNYRVDTRWNKQPLTFDWAMSLLGQGHPKEDYHFTSQERRDDMRQLAYNTGNFGSLGEYLHADQDSFSHQKNGEPFGPGLGHFDISTKWFTDIELQNGFIPVSRGFADSMTGNLGEYLDRTYNRPELADEMAKKTYDELRNFISVRDGVEVPDKWNEISDNVKKFNRFITEDNDKKGESLFE